MRVLEDEDHRVIAREAINDRDESGLDIVDKGRFLDSFRQPEQKRKALDGPISFRRVTAAVDELSQQARDLLGRVPRVDSRKVADDRRHRREGRGVGVRPRLAAQDHDCGADTGSELVCQAGLADSWLPNHGDEHRAPCGGRQAKALVEDGLLAGAADEGNRAPRGAGAEPVHRECVDRLFETLRSHAPAAAERNHGRGQSVGRAARQELPRQGRRLQPRRDVHHRPGHEHLAAGVAPHRRLPGFDSDTDLERLGEPGRLAEASGPSANGQARTHRT